MRVTMVGIPSSKLESIIGLYCPHSCNQVVKTYVNQYIATYTLRYP